MTAKRSSLRTVLFALLVLALVCVPFALLGDEFGLSWLRAQESRKGLLTLAAIVLLAADSVAPVPSTVVILFLAAKAGWLLGIVGGTLGLCASVLTAAWVGRTAVGRLAPSFVPEAELARLRAALQQRLTLTLACMRSVPVLAETSILIAAAMGIPTWTLLRVTLLPNFAIAVIYSVAVDDSWQAAVIAFCATVAVSWLLWRRAARPRA